MPSVNIGSGVLTEDIPVDTGLKVSKLVDIFAMPPTSGCTFGPMFKTALTISGFLTSLPLRLLPFLVALKTLPEPSVMYLLPS